jgi:hypothetical protein
MLMQAAELQTQQSKWLLPSALLADVWLHRCLKGWHCQRPDSLRRHLACLQDTHQLIQLGKAQRDATAQ